MRRSFYLAAVMSFAAVGLAHADGDPAQGLTAFKKRCSACHVADAATNRVGPSLKGVVGRKAGSVADYTRYTADMKNLGVSWDEANLDKYLSNPKGMVADTTMVILGKPKGLDDATERGNVIAYLKQQSGS